MTDWTIVLAIVGAYLLVCLFVGMRAGRRSSASAEGFVAGDRSMGLLVTYFITGATVFSAFAFLGTPGWAYSRGVAVCYVLGYGTLGFLPFYFLGPRAARLGRARGFVTQAELVAARFRMPAIAIVMALLSVLAFVPYLALQMKGAGIVLEAVTRGAVTESLGAAIVYGVVLVYVLRSGVLGVGWTNALQGVFMIALAWAMGLYLPHLLYGGIGPMFDRIAEARPELLRAPGLTGNGKPWSWSEYSSAVVVSAIGFSFFPHLFMKAFTARDEDTLRRTVVLFPTFQVFLVPVFLMGFAGVLFPDSPAEADQVLPHLLMHLDLPAVVVGLFCAGALAASMSSGDAIAHATASIVVRDGCVTGLRARLDPVRERRWIRVVLVFVVLGSYAMAVTYEGSLVGLLLRVYGPVGQFAPPVVATLCWRRASGHGVLAGLLVGVSVVLLATLFPDLRPWPVHAGLYGLAANVLALVTVSLTVRSHRGDPSFLAIASTPMPAAPRR